MLILIFRHGAWYERMNAAGVPSFCCYAMDMESSVWDSVTMKAILDANSTVRTSHVLLLIDNANVHQDTSPTLIVPITKGSLIVMASTGDIEHPKTVGTGINRRQEILSKPS
jgi:hypothetical protein